MPAAAQQAWVAGSSHGRLDAAACCGAAGSMGAAAAVAAAGQAAQPHCDLALCGTACTTDCCMSLKADSPACWRPHQFCPNRIPDQLVGALDAALHFHMTSAARD